MGVGLLLRNRAPALWANGVVPTKSYDETLKKNLDTSDAALAEKLDLLEPNPDEFGYVLRDAANSSRNMRRLPGGWQIMKTLVDTLDSYDVKRSPGQRELHRYMLMTHARIIFGASFSDNIEKILEYLDVEKIRQELFAMLARREGKTWASGMFVAATTRAIPDMETSIYSPGLRQSVLFMEVVVKFLIQIPGMEASMIRQTSTKVWVQGPYGRGDIRKVTCYPCNVSYSLSHHHQTLCERKNQYHVRLLRPRSVRLGFSLGRHLA